MTDSELLHYLEEHLGYEVLMLSYCRKKIRAGVPQLDWNAYFEAFWVHARLLREFLDGSGKRSDDVKARRYLPDFRSEEPPNCLLQRVNKEVFHPTAKRYSSPDVRKLALHDAEEAWAWLMISLKQFDRGLEPHLRDSFKLEANLAGGPIGPTYEAPTRGPTGPAGPQRLD